jgi:hypothetical protein
MDEFLHSLGFQYKYDDLSPDERATVHAWYETLRKNELTLPKVTEFVTHLKEIVENELTKSNIPQREDIFLKARLRNLMLLEGLLLSPEKARKQIEREASGFKK